MMFTLLPLSACSDEDVGSVARCCTKLFKSCIVTHLAMEWYSSSPPSVVEVCDDIGQVIDPSPPAALVGFWRLTYGKEGSAFDCIARASK